MLSGEMQAMGTKYGTEGNDTLTVSTWDSTWSVYGYGGNDAITISISTISTINITAGAGNDTVYVQHAKNLTLHGDDGDDIITVIGGSSSGSRVIYGDAGNDTIRGSNDAEYIYGGIGDDRIFGFQGVDHLMGDAGNDTLVATLTSQAVFYDGGAGDEDTLIIEADSSYLWYEPNIASLSGIEKIQNTDPGKAAYLVGSGLDLGNIELVDILGVKGNNSNNLLRSGISHTIGGELIVMTVQGFDGNDSLRGDDNPDNLDGGNGNDSLYGFKGDDILTGGAGSDEFHFYPNEGVDTIEDFEQGQDFIYIHMTGLYDISSMTTHVESSDPSTLIVNVGSVELKIANGESLTLTNGDFVFAQTTQPQ